MTFNEKLNFLMETFNSKNSKLAKAINVDASLVSKWRNGKRTLSVNSEYLEMIADYFLNINMLQRQEDTMIGILKRFNPNINIANRIQMKRYLIEWILASDDEIEGNKDSLYNLNNYRNFDINNILERFSNPSPVLPDQSSQDAPDDFKINVAKGRYGCYEIFEGNEGKRQVLLNIVSMLLTSDKPVEILLCDESSMDWLIEDKKFFINFGNMLNHLIAKGHRILIIHNVNRVLSQIMTIMDFWLPLHLTGSVESYFSSRTVGGTGNKTLCIACNTAAIISVSQEGGPDKSHVFMTKDQLLVRIAEDIFMSNLVKCHPLVKIYRGTNIDKFFHEMNEMEERLGSIYILRNKLNSLTIPVEVYSKLLDTLPLKPYEKKERLDFHIRRVDKFTSRIKRFKYVEVINIDAFMEFDFSYDGLDLFFTEPVKAQTDNIISHIKNTISFLKKYENYQVLFGNFNSIINHNRLSITVKTDSTAIVSSCDVNKRNPVIMLTNQDHIVEGIKCYLIDLIDSIPASKLSKEYVISKLEEVADALKDYINL